MSVMYSTRQSFPYLGLLFSWCDLKGLTPPLVTEECDLGNVCICMHFETSSR